MKTYLVGGAVRDRLMGKAETDMDWVVVGGTPEQMLAEGYEQVGASFPVFLHPVSRDEYALARTETKNGDGYHGFDVKFGKDITLEEDLSRRDLTMNSIAFDVQQQRYIDPFDGIGDIRRRVLRHTSAAFSDDPLRVIRLARFAGRFKKFSIHHSTLALAKKLVAGGELNHLPHERHAAELVKVLETCDAEGVCRFFDVLMELNVGEHVTFYRDVDLKWLKKLAKVCCSVDSDHAVTLFAGLARSRTMGDWWPVQVGGADALKLHRLIDQVRVDIPVPERAEFMHEWLREAGVFQRDAKFYHLLGQALTVGHMAGEWHCFTAREVHAAIELTRSVAETITPQLLADGVQGKAIGEAIKADRLRLLRQAFPST